MPTPRYEVNASRATIIGRSQLCMEDMPFLEPQNQSLPIQNLRKLRPQLNLPNPNIQLVDDILCEKEFVVLSSPLNSITSCICMGGNNEDIWPGLINLLMRRTADPGHTRKLIRTSSKKICPHVIPSYQDHSYLTHLVKGMRGRLNETSHMYNVACMDQEVIAC